MSWVAGVMWGLRPWRLRAAVVTANYPANYLHRHAGTSFSTREKEHLLKISYENDGRDAFLLLVSINGNNPITRQTAEGSGTATIS